MTHDAVRRGSGTRKLHDFSASEMARGMRARPSRLALAALAAALLGGCAASGVPEGKDFDKIASQSLEERTTDYDALARQIQEFLSQPAVTEMKGESFVSMRFGASDRGEIPEIEISDIDIRNGTLGDALEIVSEKTGLGWYLPSGYHGDGEEPRFSVSLTSPTMLEDFLDQLADLTSSFYAVRNGNIFFYKEAAVSYKVPRILAASAVGDSGGSDATSGGTSSEEMSSQAIIGKALEQIGGKDVFFDRISGMVSAKADRATLRNIESYLRSFNEGVDMIIYDMWIIEREIGDESGLGVDLELKRVFDDIMPAIDPADITERTKITEEIVANGPNATSKVISGTLGVIDVKATARFLRLLGKTETISRPTIAMLSGGESSFESGITREYVKSVKTSVSESDATTSQTTTYEPEIEEAKDGLFLNVKGSYNGGVVSTALGISYDEFIDFDTFDIGGSSSVKLPITRKRRITTNIEARPGEIVVIGGIIRDKDNIKGKEVVGLGIPTSRTKSAEKSETVIMIRPRIVKVRPSKPMVGSMLDRSSRKASAGKTSAISAKRLIEDENIARKIISGKNK